MNVYVETNFVLELVFEQEQCQWCEDLVTLSDAKKIRLLLPAYCLVEPYEKLARQGSTRSDLHRSLNSEIRQLSRTTSYKPQIQQIRSFANLLLQSVSDEQQRFDQYLTRLISVSDIIPLTAEIILAGKQNESLFNLSPQDAIVYASVIAHLRQQTGTQSCFLNRNSRDFDVPAILQELNQYNCRMIPLFDQGYHYINTRVT